MASIVVRFPDGAKEFRYPERLPEVGTAIWHDSERYRVISVSEDERGAVTVIVELDARGIGDVLNSEEGALHLEELG